jgi:large subunit ribosomal protein L17
MRHGKKFNHLGRKPAHRKAMLSNMASSLIMEKRISTTVAKAKALRKYVEPLLTKSKTDDTNSRRVVFSYLQNKESVSELFNEVADKIASRPGGYTRILKTGHRLGDNADMCVIELVDYNEALLTEAKPEKAKTRRSRRGKSGSTEEKPAAKATDTVEAVTETVEDAVVEEEQAVEDVATEETVEEEVPAVEAEEEKTPQVEEVIAEEATETVEETPEEVIAEEAVEESTPEVAEDAPEEENEEESPADDAPDEEEKKD